MPSQTPAPPVPPLAPSSRVFWVGGAHEEPQRAGFQFAHTLIEGVPETVIADKRPGDPVITSPEMETVRGYALPA